YTSAKKGDDMCSFVSSDGSEYICQHDGQGFNPAGSVSSGHFQICKITTEATLSGTQVNAFANYPAGDLLYQTGLFGFDGNLYIIQNNSNAGLTPELEYETFGNIIKSPDYGATWNSWQAPGTFNAGGVLPNPIGSAYAFARGAIGAVMPVRYAADDGTIGYLTANNRFDGGDGFIYMTYLYTGLVNNSNMYLLRIPRAQLELQTPGAFQYWVGPSPASMTPAAFVNDANWSSSDIGATAIYSAANQVSWSFMSFIPVMNRYIIVQWYYDYTGGVVSTSISY